MALDYLPSPGWAVIYGETPSASRWSELGENDDALATGAGLDDNAIIARHITAAAVNQDKWRNNIAFSAYRLTDQSIAANTFVVMTLNATSINVGGHYNTSTNRFVAPVAGVYLFNAKSRLSFTGRSFVIFYKNGVEYRRCQDTSTGQQGLTGTTLIPLAAGDYVQFVAWADAAITLGSGENGTYFDGFLVTRT